MLSLTKKTDYALIALAHLTRREGGCASAREIGDSYGVPLPLLMNVLKALTRGGLIQSVRGAHGGYALAVNPTDITLANLIETVEGPVRFVRCASEDSASKETSSSQLGCGLEGTCPIRLPAMRVHDRLRQFLSTVTVSEITEECETILADAPGEAGQDNGAGLGHSARTP